MYLSVIGAPADKRTTVLNRLVREYDADSLVDVMSAFLRHTDGFNRDDWFPDYVHYLMEQYLQYNSRQARQFFHAFWTRLIDENSMPWLSPEVKHGIIEELKPHVDIQETFEGATFTYSQTRAAGL